MSTKDTQSQYDQARAEAFAGKPFDAIHDQARPLNVLKGIHRALKACT